MSVPTRRTHVRVEAKHELLVTNRLILQPLAEVEIYGKDDPERMIGAGLSSADIGLRLRYEIRRELSRRMPACCGAGGSTGPPTCGAQPVNRPVTLALSWE